LNLNRNKKTQEVYHESVQNFQNIKRNFLSPWIDGKKGKERREVTGLETRI